MKWISSLSVSAPRRGNQGPVTQRFPPDQISNFGVRMSFVTGLIAPVTLPFRVSFQSNTYCRGLPEMRRKFHKFDTWTMDPTRRMCKDKEEFQRKMFVSPHVVRFVDPWRRLTLLDVSLFVRFTHDLDHLSKCGVQCVFSKCFFGFPPGLKSLPRLFATALGKRIKMSQGCRSSSLLSATSIFSASAADSVNLRSHVNRIDGEVVRTIWCCLYFRFVRPTRSGRLRHRGKWVEEWTNHLILLAFFSVRHFWLKLFPARSSLYWINWHSSFRYINSNSDVERSSSLNLLMDIFTSLGKSTRELVSGQVCLMRFKSWNKVDYCQEGREKSGKSD